MAQPGELVGELRPAVAHPVELDELQHQLVPGFVGQAWEQ